MLNLDSFDVSPTLGFLSDRRPLPSFNNPYSVQLDKLAASLPVLILTGSLRRQIDALTYLDPVHLSSDGELKRVYVVLGFLIHAYVWGGSQEKVPLETIPA